MYYIPGRETQGLPFVRGKSIRRRLTSAWVEHMRFQILTTTASRWFVPHLGVSISVVVLRHMLFGFLMSIGVHLFERYCCGYLCWSPPVVLSQGSDMRHGHLHGQFLYQSCVCLAQTLAKFVIFRCEFPSSKEPPPST